MMAELSARRAKGGSMRNMLKATASVDRSYIEAHIASVVAIGLDYGFDIELSRRVNCTDIRLKQYYTHGLAAVEISLHHSDNNSEVEIQYVMFDVEEEKYIRSEKKIYPYYNSDALECIMNMVWNTKTN